MLVCGVFSQLKCKKLLLYLVNLPNFASLTAILFKQNCFQLKEGQHSLRPASSPPPPRQETPVLKVAERVRLRKMDRHVTGSDLASLGVCMSLLTNFSLEIFHTAD